MVTLYTSDIPIYAQAFGLDIAALCREIGVSKDTAINAPDGILPDTVAAAMDQWVKSRYGSTALSQIGLLVDEETSRWQVITNDEESYQSSEAY